MTTHGPVRLTSRQYDVLADLGDVGDKWVRPMDLGGRNGSDHSAVLRQLVRKGLVHSKRRPGCGLGGRGSMVYRISPDTVVPGHG